MAELKENIDDQVAVTIQEFNERALRLPDENSVLDATDNSEVRHANIYRDYVTKSAVRRYLMPHSSDVILDFGCGMGRLAKYLSPLIKQVEGVDRAEEMIKVAKASSLSNAHFSYSSSHLLPYDDEHFSKTLACWVVQHINDDELQKVLSEIHRTLRSGGRLTILEQTRKQAQWFGRVQYHRTIEDYVSLLNDAGFKKIKVEHAMRYPSYALSLWNRSQSMPKILLPFLAFVERATLERKPEFAEYYTTAFVFEK